MTDGLHARRHGVRRRHARDHDRRGRGLPQGDAGDPVPARAAGPTAHPPAQRRILAHDAWQDRAGSVDRVRPKMLPRFDIPAAPASLPSSPVEVSGPAGRQGLSTTEAASIAERSRQCRGVDDPYAGDCRKAARCLDRRDTTGVRAPRFMAPTGPASSFATHATSPCSFMRSRRGGLCRRMGLPG